MDVPCSGHVLLVGDGDFSFTLSLLRNSPLMGTQVTTSNLDTAESIQQHKLASDNMNALMEMGVRVFLETDARELHTHPEVSKNSYDRIIFNFPLADRHNIKKNRALLADFFSSCSQILHSDGQVMVTLCKGQGGTPADQPMRSWHDSWQILAMASNAGFILTKVLPFEAPRYPEYHSVGFRFQDKSFNTEGALTHIFEKAELVVERDSISGRGSVECCAHVYSCSQYVAEKVVRNLTVEVVSPLCMLKERLEEVLIRDLGAEIIAPEKLPFILKGHRSRVTIDTNNTTIVGREDVRMSVDDDDVGREIDDGAEKNSDVLENMKDKKNKANLDRMMKVTKSTSSHVHGVDQDGDGNSQPGAACLKRTETNSLSRFLPTNSESVYIAVRGKASTVMAKATPECSGESVCPLQQNETTHDATSDASDKMDVDEDNNTEGAEHLSLQSDVSSGYQQNLADRVFHFRASLVENFQDFISHLSDNDIEGVSDIKGKKSEGSLASDEGVSVSTTETSKTGDFVGKDDASTSCSDAFGYYVEKCYVSSGQCFLPGPITPDQLSVRHEMMIVWEAGGNADCCKSAYKRSQRPKPAQGLDGQIGSSHSSGNHPQENSLYHDGGGDADRQSKSLTHSTSSLSFSQVCDSFISCLQNSRLFKNTLLRTCETNPASVQLTVDGVDEVRDVRLIYMEAASNTDSSSCQTLPASTNTSPAVAGLFCRVKLKDRPNHESCACVLELENILCQLCSIQDPRLLWSQHEKFLNQFQTDTFPQQLSPLSLYPMKFVHDLSFWEKEGVEFDEYEMLDIIRNMAGDLVIRVSLIDQYSEPSTGRRSRCYRLHFLSYHRAFPYLVSWKLQSQIRVEVAQKLGVTLR